MKEAGTTSFKYVRIQSQGSYGIETFFMTSAPHLMAEHSFLIHEVIVSLLLSCVKYCGDIHCGGMPKCLLFLRVEVDLS